MHDHTDRTDARERAADALTVELQTRDVTFRRIDTVDVTVLVPDDRALPPIWVTGHYIRWRVGPGVNNVETHPLDGAVEALADRVLQMRDVCPICGGTGVSYAGDDEPRPVRCSCQGGEQ